MSQPTRSERGPGRAYGALRPLALLGALAALGFAQCTFPRYETDDRLDGTGGLAGNGGSSGSPASGAESLGAAGPSDGGAGGVGSGGAPGCAGEQWPVNRCEGGCLQRYPDHCYDAESSDQEVGVDCGGECQPCSNEVCVTGNDCLSGACESGDAGMSCHASLVVTFTAHELNDLVGSTAFGINLVNAERLQGKAFTLKDLEIRYYFDRNGVIEPIVIRATQSNFQSAGGENLNLKSTSWLVERTEDSEEASYNAYVSIAFGDPGQLFPADKIVLYQQMLTGETASSTFDQRANYSHSGVQGSEWLRVNVFYQGRLIWGLEPRPSNPRACFVKGINLNGTAPVTIDGHTFQSDQDAKVTTSGSGISQASTLYPPVSGGLATLLASATKLQAGQTLQAPVDNGEYLAYLYVVSPSNDALVSALTVEGEAPLNSGTFRAQVVDPGFAWARLGPYRVDVTDAAFDVGVSSGAIGFAGIELWYPE